MSGFHLEPCGLDDKGQYRNDTVYMYWAMWADSGGGGLLAAGVPETADILPSAIRRGGTELIICLSASLPEPQPASTEGPGAQPDACAYAGVNFPQMIPVFWIEPGQKTPCELFETCP